MNLISILSNSAIGQRLFSEDLKDRSDDRKKLLAKREAMTKQLAEVSNKQIPKLDAEMAAAEKLLISLREKRYQLIIEDNQKRETLTKNLALIDKELRRQSPAVLTSLQTAIFAKLKKKSFLQQDQASKAQALISELNTLIYSTDDQFILSRACQIERELEAL